MAPKAGDKVFVRAVTMYYTGEVVSIGDGFLDLKEAAWIADTGRFANALATGSLNEVEPYPGEGLVSINLGAIVDTCPWNHKLPRATK